MPLLSEKVTSINDRDEDLNQLIQEERSYNGIELEKELYQNVPLLNKDQRSIYDAIIKVVKHGSSCFFIDGSDGISKTFLYNTMLVKVKLLREIALAVAFGVVVFLIIDGKTAHSQFKILIKLNEFSYAISHEEVKKPI